MKVQTRLAATALLWCACGSDGATDGSEADAAAIMDGSAARADGGTESSDADGSIPLELPDALVGLDLSDPAPVAADTAGELTSHGLRAMVELKERNYPADLTIHELDQQAHYPAGRGNFYQSVALNRSAAFLSGADASAKNALSIVRMTQTGFVPQTTVAGYTDVPGNFYAEGSAVEGRFQLFTRRSANSKGIEVVDAARGRRHGFVIDDVYRHDQLAKPAATGPYFTVLWAKTEGTTVYHSWGWAKITQTGVTPLIGLPDGTRSTTFSGDGRSLFYLRESSAPTPAQPIASQTLHAIALPNGARAQPAIASELKLTGVVRSARGANVYVQARYESTQHLAWYEVDPSGRTTLVSDGAQSSPHIELDPTRTLLEYSDGATRRLVVIDGGTTRPIAEFPETQTSWTTRRLVPGHVTFSKDGALHAAAFDGEAVLDVVIGEASERGTYNCIAVHDDLLTFSAADGGYVFVSLAQPAARRFEKVAVPAGATAPYCLMKHPSKPLFLYVVQTAEKFQLWVVEATSHALGTPALKREIARTANLSVNVLLFGG